MPKIDIEIIDTMGNTLTLPLPDDAPLDELTASIVTLADLKATDDRGRDLNYRLFSRRMLKVLNWEGTLFTNGVLAGDQLRVVPAPHGRQLALEMLTPPATGTLLTIQPRNRVALGRGADNDIVIRDPIVSRQHGELLWQDGLHIYRDLNSANGSYINNMAVTEPIPMPVSSILSVGESIRLLYRETSTARQATRQPSTHTDAEATVRTSLTPLPRAGIFISYADEDLERASAIVKSLRRANFHVFWRDDIPPGSNVEEAIESGLRFSDVMIPVLTPNAPLVPDLQEEWLRFMANQKPLVLARFDACDIPEMLHDCPVVNFKDSQARLMQELVALVIKAIH